MANVRNMPAALIVNTRSRKGAAFFKAARQVLRDEGFNLVGIYPVRRPRELVATAKKALDEDGAELIILGSGDGTVSEVVDVLAHHRATLAFLPLGTTNNFARTLGIPLDFDGVIKTLLDGKTARVDLGLVNDDYFANICAAGLSASIARMVSHQQKRWLGRTAYALTGVRALLKQRPFQAEITDETGKMRRVTAWQIVVANGRFHAGRPLDDSAHITSGSLVVYSIEGASRLGMLRALVGYVLGNDRQLPHVRYAQVKTVSVATDPVQTVEVDGELKAVTPFTAKLAPGALKIIVPKNFQNNGEYKD